MPYKRKNIVRGIQICFIRISSRISEETYGKVVTFPIFIVFTERMERCVPLITPHLAVHLWLSSSSVATNSWWYVCLASCIMTILPKNSWMRAMILGSIKTKSPSIVPRLIGMATCIWARPNEECCLSLTAAR